MRKGWKIFWIVCGIALCLGIAFCIAGRMMGVTFYDAALELDDENRWFSGLLFFGEDDRDGGIEITSRISGDREYGFGERAGEPGFEKCYSGVGKVDVDAAGIQLQVMASPDKDVHIEAVNIDKKLKFKCTQDGDELNISTSKNFHAINQIDGYATVWLLIPEGQLEELELNNDAGEVYIADAAAMEFAWNVGAGQAVVDSFTAQKADQESGAGQITASGTILAEGDISCGVGEIALTLHGRRSSYTCDVDCGIGEVIVDGESYAGIGISKSDDDYHDYDDDYHDYDDDYHDYDDDYGHHEDEHHGGKELSVECGIGSVSIEFI